MITDILLEFIQKHKYISILYVICSLSTPIIDVLLPHYYGKFIDSIKNNNSDGNVKMIVYLWIVAAIMNYCMVKIDSILIPALHVFIVDYITTHIVMKMKDRSQELNISMINSIIIKLPSLIEKIVSQLKISVFPTLLMIFASFLYLFYVNIRLGIVFSIYLGITYIIVKSYIHKCCQISKNSNESNTSMLENITDLLSNISNVQSFNTYEIELDKLKPIYNTTINNHSNAITHGGTFRNVLNIVFTLLLFTINTSTYYLYKQGKIELDALLTIFIINTFIYQHLTELAAELRYLFYNIGTLQSIQESLNTLIASTQSSTQSTTQKPSQTKLNTINNYDIAFNDVCVYVKEKPLIRNLTLTIPQYQKVGLIGDIGSGKTTLLLILMRMKAFNGEITVGNQPITELDIDTYRSNFSYIQQQPKLFNRSVYENIMYGTTQTTQDIDNLITKYNLGKIFANINLNEKVGKAGEYLSGGQRQIVSLLRCFNRKCNILLLDEVTSSLDQELKRYVMRLLDDLMINKTVIVVTHDTYLLNTLDRIITLRNGNILSDTLQ